MADYDQQAIIDGYTREDPTEGTHIIDGQELVEPGPVFKYLNPKRPREARRRVGEIYWKGWRRLIMSSMLFLFGVTFTIIGLVCMLKCDEFDRAVAFFVVGMLMLMPGSYGTITLVMYIRGRPGYRYTDLPEFEY